MRRIKSRAGAIASVVALGGAMSLIASRLVRRGTRWGTTEAERTMRLPGDDYLDGERTRTVMTRAVSIAAPPKVVWPRVAQMGRGAGWYSLDRLDNGGIASARHIVSWIPPPRIGDASGIGWLRHLEVGRSLTWWLPGQEAFGSTLRMVIDIRLDAEAAGGTRLVIRISGDGTGTVAAPAICVFEVVDSIMAISQLRGIKSRAEAFGARTVDPARPETGEWDQFQLYETIWASGERAGIRGREHAARWRQDAEASNVFVRDFDGG